MESLTFTSVSHVILKGHLSFSVGWAPLVESWLIQRMDLGRMFKLGGSKIHATNVFFKGDFGTQTSSKMIPQPSSDHL